jgi:hypothetical protein
MADCFKINMLESSAAPLLLLPIRKKKTCFPYIYPHSEDINTGSIIF